MPWPFTRRTPDATTAFRNTPAFPSVTGFAFNLFRELAAQDPSGNIFFSPASIQFCLSLLYDGARGETRRGIAEALGISGLSAEEAQLAHVRLKSALHRSTGPGLQLLLATSLWCQRGIAFDPAYIAHAREMYDADVNECDFAQPDAASRINAWVSQKTAGKITKLASAFDPLTFLVALNAIYFKGLWTEPFLRELTKDAPFVTGRGEKKILPTMLKIGTLPYYEQDEFQVVSLPYADSDLAMFIFLPAPNSSLGRLHQILKADAWETWMKRFDDVGGSLHLPRIKIGYTSQLRAALTSLGMGRAFDRASAEFGGIKNDLPPLWVGDILHRAVAEVNEKGTEAAAATMTMMFGASPGLHRPRRHFEMIVDRPFLFIIREGQAGNILFLGSVVDPQ